MYSIFKKRPGSLNMSGFTLPELLVAATISLGIISLGGFGLVSILTSSQVANAQNERRTELNRSLEFVSAEVRQAEKVEATSTLPSEFTLPTGATLALKLFPVGSTTPVIYYVASPSPSDNTWRGPNVVYRWGPQIQDDGSYLNDSAPGDWTSEPLIDLIEETGALPTCPSDWSGNGTAGFFACVNDTGSIVQLYQQGQVVKSLGLNETYQTNSTAVTRPLKAVITPGSASPGSGPTGSPGSTSFPPGKTFTVDEGTINIGDDATITVRAIGGEVTCGPGGPSLPTDATLRFDFPDNTTDSVRLNLGETYTRSVSLGTEITVDGNLDFQSCSPGSTITYNSSSDQDQVITLYNGERAPSFEPFGGQTSIISFLEDAGVLDGSGNTSLQLADNQVVFLYELGTTQTSSSAFDMQDAVVEAEISPS